MMKFLPFLLAVFANLFGSTLLNGQQSAAYGVTGDVAFPPKSNYDFQLLYMEPAKQGTSALGVFRLKWKGEKDTTIWGSFGSGRARVLSAPNCTRFSLHVGSSWKPIWTDVDKEGEGPCILERNKNYIVEVDLNLMADLFGEYKTADKGVVWLLMSHWWIKGKYPNDVIVSDEFPLPLDFSKYP